jgi:hypothetical protein
MTAKPGDWTKMSIAKDRAREDALIARTKYLVTCGGEAKLFDNYREALGWARLLEQSPTACNATIEEVR